MGCVAYCIVSAETATTMEESVTRHSSKGWNLHGMTQVVVVYDSAGVPKTTFYQPMIMPKDGEAWSMQIS